MVAAQSSRVNRQYKKKYRIRNWREYERGLRSRGDVTIWLSEDAIAAWVPPKNGLRGGQRRYSNLAVRTALTLRVVFSLPLRQTEGFLDSLLRLMGLNLKAPDHTTLSRRNQIVAVPPLTRSHDGPIDLIVDSTGLKILGCGEWNAHKHKASKKRRDWRKLHIGVDAEGFIVAAELTASSRDAASTLPALLDTIEVPIRRFTADGAYDHRSVYDQLSAAGTENVVIVIPPRRSAEACTEVDFLLILNKPASLLQHRINVVARLLFGCLVDSWHSDHPPFAFDLELVGGASASNAWCSSTYVRMNSRSTWEAGLSCAWHTCTKRSRRSRCTLMRKPVSFISASVANGCTFVEKTLPLEKLTGASQRQLRKQGLAILPPKPENST